MAIDDDRCFEGEGPKKMFLFWFFNKLGIGRQKARHRVHTLVDGLEDEIQDNDQKW